MTFLDFLYRGLSDSSITFIIVYTLVFVQITIAAVTIFLHRHQAHRALELHPIVSHFFRFWLWIGTGMQTKAWAAIHRKHHAKCETAGDPHSPQVMGLAKVLGQGVELYRKEAKNAETLLRYGHGTPDDWIERNIYSKYSILGVSILVVAEFFAFGVLGITVWAIQMLWIPILAAGVINGIGHYWGYRNFASQDAATNVFPWGILIGGEELHNNHHTFPTSAKLSVRWYEFDLGWLYIRTLQFFGLAKPNKVAPYEVLASTQMVLSEHTLEAIIVQRYHVMASYVAMLKKVWHAEKLALNHKDSLLIKRFFSQKAFNSQEEANLEILLSKNQTLNKLNQMRAKLIDLWSSHGSREEILQKLRLWCDEAEKSAIPQLKQFSAKLRSYRVSLA